MVVLLDAEFGFKTTIDAASLVATNDFSMSLDTLREGGISDLQIGSHITVSVEGATKTFEMRSIKNGWAKFTVTPRISKHAKARRRRSA